VTGFLQVQRHWVAHDAGADKSDFSHEKILLFLCCSRLWTDELFVARGFIPVGQRSCPKFVFAVIQVERMCRFYDCFAAERGGATIR
jgi:hypothetical protein